MIYKRKEKYVKPKTPAEVLKLALEREKTSFKFYQQLVKKEKDPNVKRIFKRMKEQELCHIRYIRDLLRK